MELHEKYDLTEEQLESVVSVLTFLYTNWQKAETELEWRVVEFTDEDSNLISNYIHSTRRSFSIMITRF